MKILIFLLLLFLLSVRDVNAVYDPISVENNKIGIHILFPEELSSAAQLVNSSGGEWGYVTIPVQTGDKDLEKWQNFMDEARELRIIPILRLATEGDFFDKSTWRKASYEDVLDFANFLNSLNWPVKNRYIIVYNEVNRADEWNGKANPQEYAQILSYTSDVFKKRNEDFFILSSGMDNAATTANGTYSQYDYFVLMEEGVPGIFDKIDGFSSHSYPNPAFAQPPRVDTYQSISSFRHEMNTINSFTNKKLPIFITETGWDQTLTSDGLVGEYFKEAFNTIWNDAEIVAITPFLLHSGPGPFEKFTMLKSDGSKNEIFNSIQSIKKIKGTPILNTPSTDTVISQNQDFPVVRFSDEANQDEGHGLKYFVKWLLLPL